MSLLRLPEHLLHYVMQRLEARDVCSLSNCNSVLNKVCSSEDLWHQKYEEAWPEARTESEASQPVERMDGEAPLTAVVAETTAVAEEHSSSCQPLCGSHTEASWFARFRVRSVAAAGPVRELLAFLASVSKSDSLEAADYHAALCGLCSSPLVFSDVARLLFRPELSVLAHLLGLHFSLRYLHVPPLRLFSSLCSSRLSHRLVWVRWWSLGRCPSVGFRLRDQMHTASVPLGDLALCDLPPCAPLPQAAAPIPGALAEAEGAAPVVAPGAAAGVGVPLVGKGPSVAAQEGLEERLGRARLALAVVTRGAVHEVMRVQISADFNSSAWVGREMHSQR